jgi:hypothetical protein
MPVNETKLNELLTRALHDWAAAMSAPLVVMGDRLGLYRALAGAVPLRPAELAERVGVPEAYARDWLANNLTPLGRGYYAASTLACVPSSLAQGSGTALGAQAGEATLAQVLREGGFTRVRCAAETPFNLVIEARP